MISIFKKEIIGIYMEKDVLHYCRAERTLGSWKMGVNETDYESSGVMNGSFPLNLREFLNKHSPVNGRKIFLALPRNRFFIRDIQLPPIPLEDALLSVQNTLSVICHLPLDDIYYEIFLCRLPDKSINALVIYALSKEISPILNIFKETGHEKSLEGLFPLSIGIGAWLSLQEYSMPLALIIPDGNGFNELAVYHEKGCVFSLASAKTTELVDTDSITDLICSKFSITKDLMFSLLPEDDRPLFDPPQNKLAWLPSISQNYGVAALSPGMSNQQQIFLNGGQPRIKMFSIWKLFSAIVVILAVFMFIWTFQIDLTINNYQLKISALKNEISQLQQNIQPLEINRDSIKKVESLFADIDDFMRLRPRLYSCYNEIARLVPEGTWFSRSNFNGSEITLHGQSRDALKVVESLRTSDMFEQVKLSGSVNRAISGVEQFSLTILIKYVETNP